MRILADENVPLPLVAELRRRGCDVVWIAEVAPGLEDHEVLSRAQVERRVMLTNDKDFGVLAFAKRLPAAFGIVILRTAGDSPEADLQRAVSAIERRADWAGQLPVVESDRIRSRSLP